MAVEELWTRCRITRKWRGKRMTVVRWRLGWLINIPAQKFAYFSELSDPLKWDDPAASP